MGDVYGYDKQNKHMTADVTHSIKTTGLDCANDVFTKLAVVMTPSQPGWPPILAIV